MKTTDSAAGYPESTMPQRELWKAADERRTNQKNKCSCLCCAD
jgi:hypothetical protein